MRMEEKLIHYRTSVCNINYHMVWSVKYRKKVLSTDVEKYLNYYWNADCVGAFNILRLYFQATGITTKMDPQYIASPHVAKVAV